MLGLPVAALTGRHSSTASMRAFLSVLALVAGASAAIISAWLFFQGQDRAKTLRQCEAAPQLQPEVPPVVFCQCFVARIDTVWNRLYRVTLTRQGRERNVKSVIYECTASALRTVIIR